MKEQIDKIISQFSEEELGNRLSQFALLGLRIAIGNVFMKGQEHKKPEFQGFQKKEDGDER